LLARLTSPDGALRATDPARAFKSTVDRLLIVALAARERSRQGPVAGWIASSRPVGGVELFSAWFAGQAYQKHRHDTYAIGVTDSGVQVFDYRGSGRASTPGQVVVLDPDEVHDGRAGTNEGFGYRIVYVAPSLLAEALRVLRGRPYPLPVRERGVVPPAVELG